MAESKGKFIVLEGVDGSGKSTQAYLLVKYLSGRKIRVLPTREPGGTAVGERIRDVLLDPNGEEISPDCELLLYMASRAQLVTDVIRPSLERGYVVVSERFIFSTIAYQGYAGGVPIDKVEAVGRIATGGLEPDLTIILDIDPQTAVRREKVLAGTDDAGYDRIEKKGVEFQEKVRAGFLELAKRDGGKIKIVDGLLSPRQVHEEIRKLVDSVLQ